MKHGSVRGLTFITMLFGTGAYFAFHKIDLALNYLEVSAKVNSVAVDCKIEDTKRSWTDQFLDSFKFMQCDQAYAFALSHDLTPAAVEHRISLLVSYNSPTDKANKYGKLQELDFYNEYKDIKPNSVIPIFVSRQKPDEILLW